MSHPAQQPIAQEINNGEEPFVLLCLCDPSSPFLTWQEFSLPLDVHAVNSWSGLHDFWFHTLVDFEATNNFELKSYHVNSKHRIEVSELVHGQTYAVVGFYDSVLPTPSNLDLAHPMIVVFCLIADAPKDIATYYLEAAGLKHNQLTIDYALLDVGIICFFCYAFFSYPYHFFFKS